MRSFHFNLNLIFSQDLENLQKGLCVCTLLLEVMTAKNVSRNLIEEESLRVIVHILIMHLSIVYIKANFVDFCIKKNLAILYSIESQSKDKRDLVDAEQVFFMR